MPTRGFTAAVSVFRGTPPQKPFKFAMSDHRHSGGNQPRVRRVAGDIHCLCRHNVETQFTHSGLGHKEKFVVFYQLHLGRLKLTTRRGNCGGFSTVTPRLGGRTFDWLWPCRPSAAFRPELAASLFLCSGNPVQRSLNIFSSQYSPMVPICVWGPVRGPKIVC